MSNKFEIIDVILMPSRKDLIVVLKIISGNVNLVSGTLCSPQLKGNWRITSVLISNTAMVDASKIAVGLDGPLGLISGMVLID